MFWTPLSVSLLWATAQPVSEFPRLPYAPYQSGDSLPSPHLPPQDTEQPELSLESATRQPFYVEGQAAWLPLECAQTPQNCYDHSLGLTLGWRLSPHFAWNLSFERSDIGEQHVPYAALGARVFAWDSGWLDPYLGLSLGAEHHDTQPHLNLATMLEFGLGLGVTSDITLAPTLRLRQGPVRDADCGGAGRRSCGWSAMGERWLYLGLALNVALGAEY